MDEQLVANYLSSLKTKTGLTYEAIGEKCKTAESTVKNLCLGKSEKPRLDTVASIVYAMGGSLDEMFNPGKSKDSLKEVSVASLKEAYEFQLSTMKETNEAHIANIRAHYEQHIAEKNESFAKIEAHYEHRLAEKREVITAMTAHIATLEKEKKWFRLGFVISIVVFAILCIVELSNPTMGWIRW